MLISSSLQSLVLFLANESFKRSLDGGEGNQYTPISRKNLDNKSVLKKAMLKNCNRRKTSIWDLQTSCQQRKKGNRIFLKASQVLKVGKKKYTKPNNNEEIEQRDKTRNMMAFEENFRQKIIKETDTHCLVYKMAQLNLRWIHLLPLLVTFWSS